MNASRGAFFDGPQCLRVRDFELQDLGPQDVLLDVAACGVCGSDLHHFFGRWPAPSVALGHEVGGHVTEVGSHVTEVQPADKVIIEPILRCGECRYCLTGRHLHCAQGTFISVDVHGGFARQMVAPAYCFHKLEGDIDASLGAFGEPLSVGLHAIRVAALTGADTVLVLGAGTIGLMTVAAARAMGAGRVLVTAKYTHQGDAARGLGADDVFEPGDDLADRVKEICPEGPDIVIETVGTVGGTTEQALGLVRKLGTVVLVGGITGSAEIDLGPIISKELRVLGSPCYGQIGVRRDFEIAAELLSSRAVDVAPLVSARYPLEEIQQAFLAAADKTAGAIKVLVEP